MIVRADADVLILDPVRREGFNTAGFNFNTAGFNNVAPAGRPPKILKFRIARQN